MMIKKLVLFSCMFYSYLLSAQQISPDMMMKMMLKRDSLIDSKKGTFYPDFSFVTLTGKKITQEDLKGKVTLLNFWFKNCSPCVAEIPAINELYLQYKDMTDFQIISFTVDRPEDAINYIKELGVEYPVCPIARDDGYRPGQTHLTSENYFPELCVKSGSGSFLFITSIE